MSTNFGRRLKQAAPSIASLRVGLDALLMTQYGIEMIAAKSAA